MRFALLPLFFLLALLPAEPVRHGTSSAISATSQSAMRAFVDPETGRLRAPAAGERDEPPQQRARAALEEARIRVERRDGMTIAHLPPERDVRLRAEVDEKGRVSTTHEGRGHE